MLKSDKIFLHLCSLFFFKGHYENARCDIGNRCWKTNNLPERLRRLYVPTVFFHFVGFLASLEVEGYQILLYIKGSLISLKCFPFNSSDINLTWKRTNWNRSWLQFHFSLFAKFNWNWHCVLIISLLGVGYYKKVNFLLGFSLKVIKAII